MIDRFTQVGFSQRIRLEWLEQTSNLVLAGNNKQAIASSLQELLCDKLSVGGEAERGNREKAITILMKIWVTVPSELASLCNSGLDLLRRLPLAEHLVVHWGMVMAVYPFFGHVAGSVGRLLRLQGTAAAAQVQRRVRERYGERDTVSRATRRVLRTLVDWGVLAEGSTTGIYVPGPVLTVTDHRLTVWLMAAALHTLPTGTSPRRAVVDTPSLFPFALARLSVGALAASGEIEVTGYSLDEDMVMLHIPSVHKLSGA